MKKLYNIPQTLFTLVDDEIYEKYKDSTVSISEYADINKQFLSRLVYKHFNNDVDIPANMVVDHIKSDEKLNNQISNVRLASRSVNCHNKPITGKSKYRCVSWHDPEGVRVRVLVSSVGVGF